MTSLNLRFNCSNHSSKETRLNRISISAIKVSLLFMSLFGTILPTQAIEINLPKQELEIDCFPSPTSSQKATSKAKIVITRQDTSDLEKLDKDELDLKKLCLKVKHSRHTIKNWLYSYGSNLGFMLTALGGGVAFFVGNCRELRKQREERLRLEEQRIKELRNKEDERFDKIVTSLGSQESSERANAAVLLSTFILPEYEHLLMSISQARV